MKSQARQSTFRVVFMGGLHRRLWWDIELRRGWLVIQAGYFRRPRLPRIYWSPNATPWHHGARNVFRARYVEREECVCGQPDCTMPQERADDVA
jgi:hypothetical protein